jgi:Na+/proline symporter
MVFIDVIALGMLMVSGYVYISLTKSEKTFSLDEFFYHSHKTTSRKYGASVAAASTSLATVILFFITGVEQYGIFLLWCGITYFLGQIGILFLLKESKVRTTQLTTVADFWLDFSKCRMSSLIVAILTALAFIFMLFLELFIGSEILSYYLGDSQLSSLLSFLFLIIIVAAYVFRGGMYAVFKSDLWQYTLMLIAMIVLAICSLLYTMPLAPPKEGVFSVLTANDETELILFLIWVTIQNLTLPFTQLSSWQRLASTSSVDSAYSGIKKIAFGFSLLWLLPVLSMLLFMYYGKTFSNIAELFDFFRNSNNLIIYISYAIIFVGFSSALFSTADSALIACTLSLTDKSTFRSFVESKTIESTRKYILMFVFLLMSVETFLFSVFSDQASDEFLSIVFVIFSQLSLISPLIVYVFYKKIKGNSNKQLGVVSDVVISVGLIVGWLTLFYFNFFGPQIDFSFWDPKFKLSQNLSIIMGSLIGFILSVSFLVIAIIVNPRPQEKLKEVKNG